MQIAARWNLVLPGHADRASGAGAAVCQQCSKREGDKHFLVTPVEKFGIRVDDAPFMAVEMQREDEGGGPVLHFRTNVDDWVRCDAEHRLRFQKWLMMAASRHICMYRNNLGRK